MIHEAGRAGLGGFVSSSGNHHVFVFGKKLCERKTYIILFSDTDI